VLVAFLEMMPCRHQSGRARPRGMPERPCGGCMMCCKLPAAPASLNKPGGVFGASLATRGRFAGSTPSIPRVADRSSAWKMTPDFPDEVRRDRCKPIWAVDSTTAIATANNRRRWRTGAQGSLPSSLAEQFQGGGRPGWNRNVTAAAAGLWRIRSCCEGGTAPRGQPDKAPYR
jgi:hypothetical protein